MDSGETGARRRDRAVLPLLRQGIAVIARALYLAAQWGHARPKRHKSSAQRTSLHLAALDGFFQLGATARVLSLGPRNIDEVEALEAQGWRVEAADLFPTHPSIPPPD